MAINTKTSVHGSRLLILVSIICMQFAPVAFAQVRGVSPQFSALIAQCAPTVHPETMAAVISAESRGHQFAIADAGPKNLPWAQRKLLVRSYYMGSLDSAVDLAHKLIANGHTVSLGPAQVNDRNLPAFGINLRQVFDPCTNIAIGGRILTNFYGQAVQQFGAGPKALRAALSAYNSGSWIRGERDGYVSLVYQQLGRPLTLRSQAVIPGAQLGPTYRYTDPKPILVNTTTRTFPMSVSNFKTE
jgi:type IV secretion system protein VirB1